MPHAINISGTQIVDYDPSKAQPLPDGWAYVSPAQYATAQSLPYPNYVDDEVVNIEPPEPEPFVPTRLTRRQAKLILLQYGLLDAVESVVATMPRAAQIEYADALSFERSNPLMTLVAETAGLTTEQVDAMFVAGALL